MIHTANSRTHRVVLFEPDPYKRALYSLVLITHGYQAEAAGDEAGAHSLCESLHPDLLLMGALEPLSGMFDVYDRFRTRYPACRIAFVPGEVELCDLFLNGDRIRITATRDFTGDVAKFLAQNLGAAALARA